jgi:hypothetical protein
MKIVQHVKKPDRFTWDLLYRTKISGSASSWGPSRAANVLEVNLLIKGRSVPAAWGV